MQVALSRDVLNTILAHAKRIAPSRTPMPILTGVMLTAHKDDDGQALTVIATDTNTTLAYSHLRADVTTPGTAVVSIAMLQAMVGSFVGDRVTLTTDKTRMVVACGQSVLKLPTMNTEEYPQLPTLDEAKQFVLPGELVRRGLSQVLFSASRDVSRAALNGVLWETVKGKFGMATTDGYRLSVHRPELPAPYGERLLFPLPAAQQIRGLLGQDGDNDVIVNAVSGGVTALSMTLGDDDLCDLATLYVRMADDAAYPDYKVIIPVSPPGAVVCDRHELIAAVRSARLISDENERVVLNLCPAAADDDDNDDIPAASEFTEQARIEVSAKSEQGEFLTPVAVTELTDTLRMVVNGVFFADALDAMTGTAVRLRYNGNQRPLVVEDPADDAFFHVLMPMVWRE